MNIRSHTIHSILKVEATQKTISWWMAKQNVIYQSSGILFGDQKERCMDTCYYRDNPWKHYTKWKKSDTMTRFYMIPLSVSLSKGKYHSWFFMIGT